MSAAHIIGIGSTRGPKVQAVRKVVSQLRERFDFFLPGEVRFEPRNVPSGTASMPRSTEEMMKGARHRAQRVFDVLMEEGLSPAIAVGLEGGVALEMLAGNSGDQTPGCLLEAWTYVTDGQGGFFGSSGCIPLPRQLVEAVVERGEELGTAADQFFALDNIRSRQGTFGVLTDDLITREEAFARAMLHALAPFYNATAYGLSSDTSTKE